MNEVVPMTERHLPLIAIPAHNEEKHIARTIVLVRETHLNAKLVVVDDGSTDKTAAIAKAMGCEVIHMPRNVGKANAFLAAAKYASRSHAAAFMTLDADMTRVPTQDLELMLRLATNASQKRKEIMVIGNVFEGKDKTNMPQLSGIRSFSMPVIHRLVSSRSKGVPKGYGLELFLSDFCHFTKVLTLPTKFEAEEAGRKGLHRQLKEIRHMDRILSDLHKRPKNRASKKMLREKRRMPK